jgi:hypothetical protein
MGWGMWWRARKKEVQAERQRQAAMASKYTVQSWGGSGSRCPICHIKTAKVTQMFSTGSGMVRFVF